MSKLYIIGIDIGGTKISVCLSTLKGRMLSKDLIRTQKGTKARESMSKTLQVVASLLNQRKLRASQLAGMGVGVPGPVDPKKEQIETSPNLPGWKGLPIKRMLERRFKTLVFLENDANAAALGEKYFGEGKGIRDFVYVTVSTGIGSGIVMNGELVRGIRGAAGEFGHTTVQVDGEKCECGKLGCLEAYASGTAIAKSAIRELRTKKIRSRILDYCKGIHDVSGYAVSKASMAGDPLAIQIRNRAGKFLGVGLANLIDLLNPNKIILGGGVLEDPHHVWGPMLKAAKRESWPYSLRNCKIVHTGLGSNVGDFGAIAVVLDRLKKSIS